MKTNKEQFIKSLNIKETDLTNREKFIINSFFVKPKRERKTIFRNSIKWHVFQTDLIKGNLYFLPGAINDTGIYQKEKEFLVKDGIQLTCKYEGLLLYYLTDVNYCHTHVYYKHRLYKIDSQDALSYYSNGNRLPKYKCKTVAILNDTQNMDFVLGKKIVL